MHYPRRGIPQEIAAAIDLVALDGTAGLVLEAYFSRGPQARTLDLESVRALLRCRREIERLDGALSSDAGRYFGRLNQLVQIVLASEPESGQMLRS